MAKKIQAYVKLQVKAGEANPAPPIGPALGQQGVNIIEFSKPFNAPTQSVEKGIPMPVVITLYSYPTFTFIIKTPPASYLVLKAAGVSKGSSIPNKNKVGKITQKQLAEIATVKMPDLTAGDLAAAMRTIAGTARNMGIEVEGGK